MSTDSRLIDVDEVPPYLREAATHVLKPRFPASRAGSAGNGAGHRFVPYKPRHAAETGEMPAVQPEPAEPRPVVGEQTRVIAVPVARRVEPAPEPRPTLSSWGQRLVRTLTALRLRRAAK